MSPETAITDFSSDLQSTAVTVERSKVDELSETIENDPEDVDSRRFLVLALLEVSDFARAEVHFSYLWERFDDHPWLADLETKIAEATGDRLRLARAQRRLERLLDDYSDPNDPPAMHPSSNKADRAGLVVLHGGDEDAPPQRPRAKLDDLIGLPAIRSLAAELSDLLGQTEAVRPGWLGGTLLYGPQGCGKAFGASVIASEIGAEFIDVDLAAEWNLKTAKRLVTTLSRNPDSPLTLVLLENVDLAAAGDYATALEPLLLSLDRAASCKKVIVIGSATYPWEICADFLAESRLGNSHLIGPPDAAARHQYIQARLGQGDVENQHVVTATTRATEGYSFAELQQLTADPESDWMKDHQPGSKRWFAKANEALSTQPGMQRFADLSANSDSRLNS
jgi:hypothetical protein